MNDDLISRKAAIDAIDAVFPVDPMKSEYAQGIALGAALAKTYVEQLPSAQPERKKGHWVEIGDEPYDEWECDMCGFVIDGSGCIDPEEYRDVYKFCPNCGADMREENT